MNSPFATKFAAQAVDIILEEVSSSKEFQLLKGSQLILREHYSYDTDHKIRISGLADVLSQALYGTLTVGEQLNAKADFSVKVTGEKLVKATVYSMRLLNPRDPGGNKNVMAAAANGVCRPGVQQLVTVIGQVTVGLTGTAKTATIGTKDKVVTANCDPKVLFPDDWQDGQSLNIGSELLLQILPPPCDDAVHVRFLNRYDMPETLTAHHLTEKPSATDDMAAMYGLRTRFGVQPSTEYTLLSGPLHHTDQFDTWQDLLTSRKAQVYWQGQWIDIVAGKGNYTRQRQKFHGSQAEITFQTANPLMTL